MTEARPDLFRPGLLLLSGPAGTAGARSERAIHIPTADQFRLFENLAKWLVPGGHLMVTVGAEEWTGVEHWHGAEMYWSHHGRDLYASWLSDLGFTILFEHFVPEGAGGHPVFIARIDPSKTRLSGDSLQPA